MWRKCHAKNVTFLSCHLKHFCQKSKQKKVTINGIKVDFPYEPYDSQKVYMNKVMACLSKDENGLLESSTGTGKTLSLLCASLAWLKKQRKLENKCEEFENRTRIIYSSRTHKQLEQVVSELKKTNYSDVKAVVLGSKDHLCLHTEVSLLSNVAAKNHACRVMKIKNSCQHYSNLNLNSIDMNSFSEECIHDVKSLLSIGENYTICPYYTSKELAKTCDIILVPYNYLIDKHIRKSHDIDVRNAVVIIDEGQNIESSLEEVSSAELKSQSLDACIKSMKTLYEIGCNTANDELFMPIILSLHTKFCELQEQLNNLFMSANDETVYFQGTNIYEIFKFCKFDADDVKNIDLVIDCTLNHLKNQTRKKSQTFWYFLSSLVQFQRLLSTLYTKEFEEDPEIFTNNYKVFAVKHDSLEMDASFSWTLNVMCLTPSIAMDSLMKCGPRSVIITSGTLSPLRTFQKQLNIPFPIKFQSKQIVNPSNLKVFTLESGNFGEERELFSSMFSNRQNEKYYLAIGDTIVKLTSLIPGGVFLFFPSYNFMKSCLNYWNNSCLRDALSSKKIFMESSHPNLFDRNFQDFKEAVDEYGSALFLGVFRGKLAEGLDSRDQYCRSVIVIGLPYPAWKEPRVQLKMEYLEENETSHSLKPNEWYRLEMARAVNQAIGRVIRHKDDYGTVFLLDHRFPGIKSQLSPWIRNSCITLPFDKTLVNVKNFYDFLNHKSLTQTQNF